MSTKTDKPSRLPRLLALADLRSPLSLQEHSEHLGPLPHRGRAEELIETVERSGLRGHGGAGFPAGTKMRTVAAAGSRRPFLIANGAEGEPASEKDEFLLAGAPHLVLDGVAAAAAAVNAQEAAICIKRGAVDAIGAIGWALDERRTGGIDPINPALVEVSDGYVAGEESAIVDHLNGGPGKPTFVPPRPYERGVRGRPTLIHNVETLASLALISRYGGDWYREVGTAEDPGSTLITITGAVASPGVYEIAGGTPLVTLLNAAGGPTAPLQAFLVGGYAGSWFAPDVGAQLRLGHASLRAAGANMGPGVIVALPKAACGVIESARVARYLADESAGQCGPCLYGLAAVAKVFEEISDYRAEPGTHRWIERWAADIAGRGACSHPDGALRFIASSLRIFADEIDRHEQGEPCRSEASSIGLLPVPDSTLRRTGY